MMSGPINRLMNLQLRGSMPRWDAREDLLAPAWDVREDLLAPAGLSLAGPYEGDVAEAPVDSQRTTTFRSLLVPLDGTPLGERALPMAVSIARRAGAELHLVHVNPPMEGLYHPQISLAFEGGERRKQIRYLERIAAQIVETTAVTAIPHYLERRDIVDGLCEVAKREGIDLAVASTRGSGWFERLWHGSTMHRLIELMAPPLLVLRGDGLRAAIAPNKWLQRMLVPLDGSRPAERALKTATALGALYDSRYCLFSVLPLENGDSLSHVSDREGALRSEPAARAYLDRTAGRLEQSSRRAESSVAVTDEPVAQAIASQAERSRADCIAIATSRRRGLSRWLRPSQAWRVIQRADVPVLVVRDEPPE
jgi:nucleotide-binding universal stress UspA family protein